MCLLIKENIFYRHLTNSNVNIDSYLPNTTVINYDEMIRENCTEHNCRINNLKI